MAKGGLFRRLAAACTVGAVLPASAFAQKAPAAKIAGNPAAGKALFISTCGVCHRLKDANTIGVAGPSLDRAHLEQALIVKAITNGGSSVMTKAAAARYTTLMRPYKNVLTMKQILDISAYVYRVTHQQAAGTSS
jgi:mono/diheme cytochrome c family protein